MAVTAQGIGGKARRGSRVVRVDRSSGSALGNPYAMTYDSGAEERAVVCAAYDELLHVTMGGGPGRPEETADAVSSIGRKHGWKGRPRKWDWEGARREMRRLARLRGIGAHIRLECHCWPRECHAERIACALMRPQ